MEVDFILPAVSDYRFPWFLRVGFVFGVGAEPCCTPRSPARGPFEMPEGDAWDEMHLLSLSQKVQWEEEEGPLPSESTSINAGRGRYGLTSSSLLWAPWVRLTHLPVEAAPLCFSSHLAREKKSKRKAIAIIIMVMMMMMIYC